MAKSEIEVRSKLNKALEFVDQKLLEVEKIKTSSFQTHGEFKWAPSAISISCKIHTENSIHDLIAIHSSLRTKRDDYNASAKQLGIESYSVFMWQGLPVDRWLFDISLRTKIVHRYAIEKDLLNKKKVLERHLSDDDKLSRTLSDLGFD